jgi:hypothetical protein
MASKSEPRKSRKKSGNIWAELDDVCRKIHARLYTRRDDASARRYQRRLERLLGELPEDDLAILRHEGVALLCELKGETCCAVEHRKREIQLMERLHKSVQRSVDAGDYNEKTGASILAGRGAKDLSQRRDILRALEQTSGAECQGKRTLPARRGGRE